MKYYVYYQNNGFISAILSNVVDSVDKILEINDELDLLNNKYYVCNGGIVLMPAKQFDYQIFDYTIKQWVDPRTNETQWIIIKSQRNTLLAESDWTQLPDVSITNKEQWATYRQELRDITTQTDPFNIIWPSKPE